MVLAEDFVCIFEVHLEVLLTAGVPGIFTIKQYQDNSLIYAKIMEHVSKRLNLTIILTQFCLACTFPCQVKSLGVVQVIRHKVNGYDASINCQTERFKFTAPMDGLKATRLCLIDLMKHKVLIQA